MSNTITLCTENPIKTERNKWMQDHIGRDSVGIDRGDHYEILAYSDQRSDRAELRQMAENMDALLIMSFKSARLFDAE